jgi:hypothetical protein
MEVAVDLAWWRKQERKKEKFTTSKAVSRL